MAALRLHGARPLTFER